MYFLRNDHSLSFQSLMTNLMASDDARTRREILASANVWYALMLQCKLCSIRIDAAMQAMLITDNLSSLNYHHQAWRDGEQDPNRELATSKDNISLKPQNASQVESSLHSDSEPYKSQLVNCIMVNQIHSMVSLMQALQWFLLSHSWPWPAWSWRCQGKSWQEWLLRCLNFFGSSFVQKNGFTTAKWFSIDF